VNTEKLQAKNEKNLTLNNSNLSEEKKENLNSDNKKDQKSMPDIGTVLAAAYILVSYVILKRRR